MKVLTEASEENEVKKQAPPPAENPWSEGGSCWRFKNTAPWYSTHTEGLEDLIKRGAATRVPVLKKEYMHSYQRYIGLPVELDIMKDKEFSQVGLQLRLEKPEPAQYDHWDRVGSIGLEFRKSSRSARIRSKWEPKPRPLDPSLVDNWSGAHSVTVISGLVIALLAFFA